jgi:hypothetical protein
MLRHTHLEHRFVHYIPEQLEPGIIYISMDYATAAHSCCCGCGEQVITPFTPTDWKMTFDGETISLWPSIGNWNFPCRSHYIIRNNRILGAEPWEDKQVASERQRDKQRKQKHDDEKNRSEPLPAIPPTRPEGENLRLWDRIKKKARRRRQ